jgi:hypothetical protein
MLSTSGTFSADGEKMGEAHRADIGFAGGRGGGRSVLSFVCGGGGARTGGGGGGSKAVEMIPTASVAGAYEILFSLRKPKLGLGHSLVRNSLRLVRP